MNTQPRAEHGSFPSRFPQPPRLLRIAEVVARTGLSKTTIWRLETAQKFPRRVRLSARATGWREFEVSDWINRCALASAPAPGGD